MERWVSFIVFFSIVLSTFALMQWRVSRAYRWWVRNTIELGSQRSWNLGGIAALILLNSLFLLRFFLDRIGIHDHPLAQTFVVYPCGISIAILTLAFLLLLVFDLSKFVRWSIIRISSLFGLLKSERQKALAYSEGRRHFLKSGGFASAAIITSAPIISSITTARDYQVNRIPLTFDNLPAGLDGLSLLQISDIHSGMFMIEQNMREIFEIANWLHPDIVLITGDFVDNSDEQIEPLYKALSTLKPHMGIYGCLGNHDHFATAARVNAALEQRNIVMLNNAHRTLKINGEHLSLVGIDDAGSGVRNFSEFSKAMEDIDPDSFKILLTHRPHMFDEARKADIDLTLAGHTHGGQVGIGTGIINLNPVYLVFKYAKGLYSEGSKHVYVNVGVGMVGVPIRLVRPEIALFTLQRPQPLA